MDKMDFILTKVFNKEDLGRRKNMWNLLERKVVFTNGCFDVVHQGHIHLLTKAADMGDELILALNADESVEKLKGAGRPIHDQETRSLILASFSFVSAVIIFDEETPQIIKGNDISKLEKQNQALTEELSMIKESNTELRGEIEKVKKEISEIYQGKNFMKLLMGLTKDLSKSPRSVERLNR